MEVLETGGAGGRDTLEGETGGEGGGAGGGDTQEGETREDKSNEGIGGRHKKEVESVEEEVECVEG